MDNSHINAIIIIKPCISWAQCRKHSWTTMISPEQPCSLIHCSLPYCIHNCLHLFKNNWIASHRYECISTSCQGYQTIILSKSLPGKKSTLAQPFLPGDVQHGGLDTLKQDVKTFNWIICISTRNTLQGYNKHHIRLNSRTNCRVPHVLSLTPYTKPSMRITHSTIPRF